MHAEQRGHIYCWRYLENDRNYPGWNLTADDAGCVSTIEICQEVLDGTSSHRTLQVSEPTADVLSVPNNRDGRARWKSPRRIRIECRAPEPGTPAFVHDEQHATVRLFLSVPELERLQDAFREIRAGQGDYAIDLAGERIWLWWHP